MNRTLVIVGVCIISALVAFSACNKNGKNTENQTPTAESETTLGYHVHVDENGETYTHANGDEHETVEVTTEQETNKKGEPVLSNSQAIDIVKNFSVEELGLEGTIEDYSFLVSTEKKKIEGKKYFEVVASFIEKNEEDDTVSIDTKGTYYVSTDGKKCLMKDMETGDVKELK